MSATLVLDSATLVLDRDPSIGVNAGNPARLFRPGHVSMV
jgi:hypothetical protein